MPIEFKFSFLKELFPNLFESPFFKTKDLSFAVRVMELIKP